jgi:hypothetical protein
MQSFKKVFLAAMAIAAGSLGIQPVLAHHSDAGFSKEIKEITGTVKEFQFKNPHSWIQVNVPDANGMLVEWSVEWGSPNQLGREGIRPSTFPPGIKVTMKVRQMTSGQPIAIFVGAKLPDGTVVGKWDVE